MDQDQDTPAKYPIALLVTEDRVHTLSSSVNRERGRVTYDQLCLVPAVYKLFPDGEVITTKMVKEAYEKGAFSFVTRLNDLRKYVNRDSLIFPIARINIVDSDGEDLATIFYAVTRISDHASDDCTSTTLVPPYSAFFGDSYTL